MILGYGRVGHSVARVLESRGFAWVAVEGDFHVAREAREAGAPVIFGEAGTQSILDRARVVDAHAMVVAIPDALATRQAVTYALGRNPRLEVVARADSEAEGVALRRLGRRGSWSPNASSAMSWSATPCVASGSATARWPPSSRPAADPE